MTRADIGKIKTPETMLRYRGCFMMTLLIRDPPFIFVHWWEKNACKKGV